MLGSGRSLDFSAIPSLPDVHRGLTDPFGVLTIAIPEDQLDAMSSVVVVDLAAANVQTDEEETTTTYVG